MDLETKPVESKEWRLEPETEYRFELDPGTSLAVKVCLDIYLSRSTPQSDFYILQLIHGQAEVFGAELAEGKQYLFGSECKAAIFTWQGCTIEISSFS
jgi:polyribonucleotide 5'-hydroxyl-kinase